MNYYELIKTELINNEVYSKVKDYSKNKYDLETRYNVGKLLIEAQGGEIRAKYGDNLIKEYSRKLTMELGKGYDATSLKRMRQFYLIIQKGAAMPHQLTWSHWLELLPIEDINEINYYINIAINRNLSYRKFHDIIKSNEYERLPEATKLKIGNDERTILQDNIPNPILIKDNNSKFITEKVLHMLILENIEDFMKQIGNNICFVGSEYPIKLGDRYNYIDILLFSIKYNAYIVVELKVTEFKAEYIGQVKKYMNYIDKNIKEINNDDTIGLIICKRENKYVIEYSSDERISVREYEMI